VKFLCRSLLHILNPVNRCSLKEATDVVRSGGVIAYPTEYCYGLGCDPKNTAAVRRILRMKRRPRYKGLILISDRLARMNRYIDYIPDAYREEILRSWPGPFTWLLPAKKSVSRWVRGKHASVAVRVTANKDVRKLCRLAGTALISTSANRSGRLMLRDYRSVCREFAGEVDYVVHGRVGDAHGPSIIRDGHTGSVIRG